jgi:2-polyprenyl-3-methyl-5-hydroxy-6-metoxy-1,4-benzoquinol methylase
MPSTKARSSSRRTIHYYEGFAREYNGQVSARPPREVASALRRMVKQVRPGGLVLELGSGPGRDADFVESLGAKVRRTDATQAFLDLQEARGKHGERLNLLTDTLGGPYDAILAMCVLIHVERAHTEGVLRKVRNALRPGGGFLVSVWEGTGETAGDYHMTYWTRAAFAARLTSAGLKVEWDSRTVDSDGDTCLTFLARRVP